nr:8275_t:CDS:1 [Entrophospora candida]CAG8550510.1 6107_t:CDS:1 [Entrophospora candida]
MASGPIGSGIAKSRQPLRKLLTIDPENAGLLGILAGVVGIAGYTLGRKATNTPNNKNVHLAKDQPFPWHDKDKDNESNDKNYKYRFHKSADPEQEILEAPNAMTTTKVQVKMPNEMAEKISPKFFEENREKA